MSKKIIELKKSEDYTTTQKAFDIMKQNNQNNIILYRSTKDNRIKYSLLQVIYIYIYIYI